MLCPFQLRKSCIDKRSTSLQILTEPMCTKFKQREKKLLIQLVPLKERKKNRRYNEFELGSGEDLVLIDIDTEALDSDHQQQQQQQQ